MDLSTVPWETVLKVASAAGGAGVALIGTTYRLLRKPVQRQIQRYVSAIEMIERIAPEIQRISAEVRPNSGGSLRDAIDRIERAGLQDRGSRRALSMALNIGLFDADTEGGFTWVNRRFSDLTGLGLEEARGAGWHLAIHPSQRREIVAQWDEAVARRRQFRERVRIISVETGAEESVLVEAWPISDSNERLVGFAGFVKPDE